MIMARQLLLVIFLCSVSSLSASPRSDLASPSQEVRDAAAKILLTSYTPPSRTNWESFLATIKVGDSKKTVLEQLRPFNANPISEEGFATGGECDDSYRLDDLWMLDCQFICISNTLAQRKLTKSMRSINPVGVDLPPKYTGSWTTYYVNGQKCHETHYTNGQIDESTAFRSDGSKSYVQHFVANVNEGEDTGYFPSGRVMYRGVYKAGVPIGIWTWYNEDGTVRTTQDRDKAADKATN
jgi:hypothetical protein